MGHGGAMDAGAAKMPRRLFPHTSLSRLPDAQ